MSDAASAAIPPTLSRVRQWDRDDPLGGFKSRFALPEEVLYLDGNSLGAQPIAAREAVAKVMDQWRDELIQAWNQGWFDAPERLGDLLAPLIGARRGEVLVSDNITLNLYKLLGEVTAVAKPGQAVLSEGGNFPTDGYIAQGFCRFAGLAHRWWPEGEALEQHLEGVSVVVLSHVNYRTGAVRDMADVTRRVHAAGAEVVWDLAHSAGALPVALNACGVRYAVGCTYKYLNGGPGAPGFVYVASERHDSAVWQPLSGWHGHAVPFAFDDDYRPADDIRRFRTGTHSAVIYAALEASLTLWQAVDMAKVRAKSLALSGLFQATIAEHLNDYAIVDITPAAACRGSQVALIDAEHGYAIVQALIARGVIGDYREPGLMRFGFTPLYLSHEDVWRAGQAFCEVLDSGEYLDPRFAARGSVT
ncbi:kynureninase [Halomonas sp. V046]|uniref:kynureninase n=1 Tax=Halomonas sp. V046 TaxID=3459611 RepID=UPI0040440BE5